MQTGISLSVYYERGFLMEYKNLIIALSDFSKFIATYSRFDKKHKSTYYFY